MGGRLWLLFSALFALRFSAGTGIGFNSVVASLNDNQNDRVEPISTNPVYSNTAPHIIYQESMCDANSSQAVDIILGVDTTESMCLSMKNIRFQLSKLVADIASQERLDVRIAIVEIGGTVKLRMPFISPLFMEDLDLLETQGLNTLQCQSFTSGRELKAGHSNDDICRQCLENYQSNIIEDKESLCTACQYYRQIETCDSIANLQILLSSAAKVSLWTNETANSYLKLLSNMKDELLIGDGEDRLVETVEKLIDLYRFDPSSLKEQLGRMLSTLRCLSNEYQCDAPLRKNTLEMIRIVLQEPAMLSPFCSDLTDDSYDCNLHWRPDARRAVFIVTNGQSDAPKYFNAIEDHHALSCSLPFINVPAEITNNTSPMIAHCPMHAMFSPRFSNATVVERVSSTSSLKLMKDISQNMTKEILSPEIPLELPAAFLSEIDLTAKAIQYANAIVGMAIVAPKDMKNALAVNERIAARQFGHPQLESLIDGPMSVLNVSQTLRNMKDFGLSDSLAGQVLNARANNSTQGIVRVFDFDEFLHKPERTYSFWNVCMLSRNSLDIPHKEFVPTETSMNSVVTIPVTEFASAILEPISSLSAAETLPISADAPVSPATSAPLSTSTALPSSPPAAGNGSGSSNNDNNRNANTSGLHPGAYAGIAVGGAAAVALGVFAAWKAFGGSSDAKEAIGANNGEETTPTAAMETCDVAETQETEAQRVNSDPSIRNNVSNDHFSECE